MRIGLETLIGDVRHFEKIEDLSDYQEKVEFIPNISPRLYEKHREEYNRREMEIYTDESN